MLCTNLIRYVHHDVKYGHVLKRLNLPRLAEGRGEGGGGWSAGKIFATILV